MFVVAGVSGNTGKVVAETLLTQGLAVRVIVRDAKKGEPWKAKGAEVAVADLKDARALALALKGATGAYLLNPPNLAVTDIPQNGRELAKSFVAAINESGVEHVVFLSSIAAQHASGNGPIAGLHPIEQALKDVRAHVTFLRAGYFMENLLANLHPMKEQGVFPAMISPEKKFDMVATADIGATAAELLRAGKAAPRVVELSGPTQTSLADAVRAFSAKLGKPLTVAPVPGPAQFDVLKSVGLPETWARAYAEMNAGFEAGRLNFEGAPRRGLISVDRFVDLALR